MPRPLLAFAGVAATACALGCATVVPRFPTDVQTAVVRDDMRRMESDQLVLYYPAPRRALAERVAARLEGCATALRAAARVDNALTRRKFTIVLPEAPFNNAYVFPPALGIEDVSVIPTGDTLDFTTAFGLPPDPGMTGCHELTHYVHLRQIGGLWRVLDTVFGDLGTPQGGFDLWFLEGLATYYEARLVPGVGRPRWPVFTSLFHAAYAGGRGLRGDSLSEYARLATPGHHYLVGAMFVGWLAETYGEPALWRLIGEQATSATIVLGVDGRFDEVYGKGMDELVAEFRRHVARRYPVRSRPADQVVRHRLGVDARWAIAPDGTTAIVDHDVDRPATLVVRGPDGAVRDRVTLAEVLPPRTLAIADALTTTGLGFTADGRELYLTALDLGATFQTTRLLRLTVGDGRLVEVARELGSGGAPSPDGASYYALASDGDRWSLVRHDLASRVTRTIWSAAPGQYALRVAVAPDGRRLAVSVWDGARWAIWLLDAATGARLAELRSATGGPVYDASFAPDGRLVFLDAVDGRFQVVVADGVGARAVITDAPYGALEPRVIGDRVRFLARDGWRYTLDEVALPPAAGPALVPPGVGEPPPPPPPLPAVAVRSDRPYSRLDGLFVPRLRVPTVLASTGSLAVGVALAGGDRLGYLRWGGAIYVDTDTAEVSGQATVIESSLAPWLVVASGQHLNFREREERPDGTTIDRDRRVRGGALTVGRDWRAGPSVALSALVTDDRAWDGASYVEAPRLGGQVALGYRAGVATPMGGAYRRFAIAADLTVLRGLDGARSIGMTGARLGAGATLGRTRHQLGAAARFRGVGNGYLTLGGVDPGATLWGRPTIDDEPTATEVPGAIAAVERLRGFEAFATLTDVVITGELDWRYPWVIDRGVTHLGFLPASFLRQLDLELFTTMAYSFEPPLYAFGGALTARFVLFRAPLALRYQLATTRLLEAEERPWEPSHLVTLTADL